MKYFLGSILLVLMLSCTTPKSSVQSSSLSPWSTTANNKTTKIKAVTSYYNGCNGLHDHCVEVLTHWNYEFITTKNPIITKPKIIFNGIKASFIITVDTASVIVSGLLGNVPVTGLSQNYPGRAVTKGSGQFGTPAFEKMLVIAEAYKEATIYYSDK